MPEPADPAPGDGQRLVFAGGCPRSGLTLLRRLVEPHSRIHCGPDTGLPPAIAMQWQAFASQLGDLHARDFDLQAEDMRHAMAELLTGLFEVPLAADPRRVLIEKTSLNIAAFEQLGRLRGPDNRLDLDLLHPGLRCRRHPQTFNQLRSGPGGALLGSLIRLGAASQTCQQDAHQHAQTIVMHGNFHLVGK